MSSMYRLPVVVVLAGLVLPLCAQRAALTGQSGGLEGYGGPAYSSYAAVGRYGVLSTAQYGAGSTPQSGASPFARRGLDQSPFMHPNSFGDSGRHSRNNRTDHDRSDSDRDDRFHAPPIPLYGVVTLYNTGYIGDSNPGFYVDLANPAPQPPPAFPVAEYDAPPVRQTAHRGNSSQTIPATDYDATADRPAAAPPPPAFRPAYQRRQPPPDPGTEAAVTLVFNDGRPDEQIHNYMLTRKTLYVQEQRLREIPVEQLDLMATEKVNQEAGVDFHLPGTFQ